MSEPTNSNQGQTSANTVSDSHTDFHADIESAVIAEINGNDSASNQTEDPFADLFSEPEKGAKDADSKNDHKEAKAKLKLNLSASKKKQQKLNQVGAAGPKGESSTESKNEALKANANKTDFERLKERLAADPLDVLEELGVDFSDLATKFIQDDSEARRTKKKEAKEEELRKEIEALKAFRENLEKREALASLKKAEDVFFEHAGKKDWTAVALETYGRKDVLEVASKISAAHYEKTNTHLTDEMLAERLEKTMSDYFEKIAKSEKFLQRIRGASSSKTISSATQQASSNKQKKSVEQEVIELIEKG